MANLLESADVWSFLFPQPLIMVQVITRKASTRVAEFAFKYAADNGRKTVTAIHKANIMKMADGLFIKCCREVCAGASDALSPGLKGRMSGCRPAMKCTLAHGMHAALVVGCRFGVVGLFVRCWREMRNGADDAHCPSRLNSAHRKLSHAGAQAHCSQARLLRDVAPELRVACDVPVSRRKATGDPLAMAPLLCRGPPACLQRCCCIAPDVPSLQNS